MQRRHFVGSFERPGESYFTSSMPQRIEYAKKYYNEYHGKKLSIGGEYNKGTNGDKGVKGTFKSGSKTFKLFGQSQFSEVKYWNGTVAGVGCGPSSCAIILTGYGFNVNPGTIAKEYPANGVIANHAKYFTNRGLKTQGPKTVTSSSKQEIINHLKKGGTILALMHNGYVGGHFYEGHFIALLGINDKNEIFIGDPGQFNNPTDGWYSIDNVLNTVKVDNYLLVSK